MNPIHKKRALITGGSKGIGHATAEILRQCSEIEVICPPRADLDLGSRESVCRFLRHDASFDILVNNAGINILAALEDIDETALSAMLGTNLLAPLQLIQGVVPHMKQSGFGRIVNVSSIWGVASKEKRTMYSLTKFGLNGVTKSLAKELGPHNILVNAVCPGYVDTELTRKNVSAAEREKITENIPLRRFAGAQEIAKFIRFLVSAENTYITGQAIQIDGGFL